LQITGDPVSRLVAAMEPGEWRTIDKGFIRHKQRESIAKATWVVGQFEN